MAAVTAAEVAVVVTAAAAADFMAAAIVELPAVQGVVVEIGAAIIARPVIGLRPIRAIIVILIAATAAGIITAVVIGIGAFLFLSDLDFSLDIGLTTTITPTPITASAIDLFRPAAITWRRKQIPRPDMHTRFRSPMATGKPCLALKAKGGAMKKLLLIIALVAIIVLVPVLAPPAAHARGGPHGGWLPGLCIGGFLGWFFGRHVDVEPVHQPPPGPPACFRKVPGHWEERWYPGATSPERVWIQQPYFERIPCPRYR